ncbi:MAG: heparinase II/III family protein [Clostridia bacterium]|nr:heparinase II/III family protein [Clostridia bacterium]
MLMQNYRSAAFWQSIRDNPAYLPLIDEIRAIYDASAQPELPSLTFSKRLLFTTTGDRHTFERNYFKRRHRLAAAAALALLYPEDAALTMEINDLIWAICDEYSWVSPAHAPFELEKDARIVDLFCAETGSLLAETMAFLGGRLDHRVTMRAKENILRRVIDVYEHHHMGWEDGTANWTAVCTANIAAALMYLAPERFGEFRERFLGAMTRFLSGFPEDGACLEGNIYWNYGFGHFVWFAEHLRQFTDGEIDLLDDKKVERIAAFAQKTILMGNTTASFSDCRRPAMISAGLAAFLHHRYPDTVRVLPRECTRVLFSRSGWTYLLRALLYAEPEAMPDQRFETTYFEGAGQYVTTRGGWSLAIKAGHNEEPHNHNDVGSFILSDATGQLLSDIGAGRYTRQYFRGERYDHLVCSSLGHSVPIINGTAQGKGRACAGTMRIDGDVITIDYAAAYPDVQLDALTRTVTLTDGGITVTDTFRGEVTRFVERFISVIPPIPIDGGVRIGALTLYGDVQVTAEEAEVAVNEPESEGRMETIYKIDIAADPAAGEITTKIDIKA